MQNIFILMFSILGISICAHYALHFVNLIRWMFISVKYNANNYALDNFFYKDQDRVILDGIKYNEKIKEFVSKLDWKGRLISKLYGKRLAKRIEASYLNNIIKNQETHLYDLNINCDEALTVSKHNLHAINNNFVVGDKDAK